MANATHKVTEWLGIILYDDKRAEVSGTKDTVQINCTSISVSALELTIKLHKEKFIAPEEIILQYGNQPTK